MSATYYFATKVVRGLDRTLLAIGALALIAMMLHVGADILLSLVFNAPLATTSAIVTNYYMVTVAFLPIMIAEFRGGHIGVSLVTDALPPGVRRWLDNFVLAATAVVYLLLTLQAFKEASDKYVAGAFVVEQTTRLIIWPAYFIVPTAFGTMTLFLVLKLLLRAFGQPSPDLPDAEAAEKSSEVNNV
jgi:TRAP-type C4-dicarboxylate transport system permease small subunit